MGYTSKRENRGNGNKTMDDQLLIGLQSRLLGQLQDESVADINI